MKEWRHTDEYSVALVIPTHSSQQTAQEKKEQEEKHGYKTSYCHPASYSKEIEQCQVNIDTHYSDILSKGKASLVCPK